MSPSIREQIERMYDEGQTRWAFREKNKFPSAANPRGEGASAMPAAAAAAAAPRKPAPARPLPRKNRMTTGIAEKIAALYRTGNRGIGMSASIEDENLPSPDYDNRGIGMSASISDENLPSPDYDDDEDLL